MRHRIPTIRSLITLIARRATGVSANLRRFAGVGLGARLCGAAVPAREKSGRVNGARFDPAPTVRRPSCPANKCAETIRRKDTFPTRRIAPRTLSRMFMNLLVLCGDGHPCPQINFFLAEPKPCHPERGLLLTK